MINLSSGKKVEFCFRSQVENIYPAECKILKVAEQYGFSQDALFSLRLAMDEALINAIIHGNKNSESKKVEVCAVCDETQITVTVRDEGDGFDQTQLADPREEPYVQKCHGRGVFLIHQFTHAVKYNEVGNEVSFTIQRSEPISVLRAM